MGGLRAGGEHRHVVVFDRDQRLVERRPAADDLGEPGRIRDAEHPVQPRLTQVRVDEADPPLEFLTHRQGEVRRRHALAFAAARARHEQQVNRAAGFGVENAGAQAAVLFRGGAALIERRDERAVERSAGDDRRCGVATDSRSPRSGAAAVPTSRRIFDGPAGGVRRGRGSAGLDRRLTDAMETAVAFGLFEDVLDSTHDVLCSDPG